MNVSARLVFVLVMAAGVAACQSDGPVPQEQGEVPGRLDDLTRDLLSVAAHVPQARQEFVDDIQSFADNGVNAHAANTFGTRLADAVEQAKLSETSARQLARTSWIAVSATELSDRQVASTREDLKAQLLSAGVSPERSEAAAVEVTSLQKVVSSRPRRWYELF
jgi:hypothetical protein